MAKEIKKPWFKSKTVWANMLLIVGGVLVVVGGELEAGTTITAVSVLNIVLRVLTKQGLK